MFQYSQRFNNNSDLESVTHLRDYAEAIGISTDFIGALDTTTDAEVLENARQVLEEEIAARLAEEELSRRHPCYIGPYAGGICTICGGRQP